jgi:hypothetical protein
MKTSQTNTQGSRKFCPCTRLKLGENIQPVRQFSMSRGFRSPLSFRTELRVK